MRTQSVGRRRLLRGAASGLVASGPAVALLAACGAPTSPVAGSPPRRRRSKPPSWCTRAPARPTTRPSSSRASRSSRRSSPTSSSATRTSRGARCGPSCSSSPPAAGSAIWPGTASSSAPTSCWPRASSSRWRVHQGGQVRHPAVPRRLAGGAALPGPAARPALPRALRLQLPSSSTRTCTPAPASSLPPTDASWTVDDLIDRARKLAARGRRRVRAEHRASRSVAPPGCARSAASCSARTASSASSTPRQSLAALQWMHDVVHKHQLAPTFANPRQEFENSALATIQATPAPVAEFRLPSSKTKEFNWNATLLPKGPSGKRGSQGTTTGYALTKLSKEPEAAWEWAKFITDKETGIEQVFGGGGSPGARSDVWNDPRLLALHPIFSTTVKVLRAAGPLQRAAQHPHGRDLQSGGRRPPAAVGGEDVRARRGPRGPGSRRRHPRPARLIAAGNRTGAMEHRLGEVQAGSVPVSTLAQRGLRPPPARIRGPGRRAGRAGRRPRLV